VDDAGASELVAARDPRAYGFTMKTMANGMLHRVLPLRDPEQPRFWCVVVVRWMPGNVPDRSMPAWIGQRGLRREELSETMGAIRADLSGWLAEPAQAHLRAWVLAPAATPASATPDSGDCAPVAAMANRPKDHHAQVATGTLRVDGQAAG
jgi:hypothetical protein